MEIFYVISCKNDLINNILLKMGSLLSKYGELINFCLRLIQVYISMNALIGRLVYILYTSLQWM